MSQGDQDKTEEPTRYRLDEARKRGEAAKSIDVAGIVVMIVAAATLGLIGAGLASRFADATRRLIAVSGEATVIDGRFLGWVGDVYAPVFRAGAPLVLGLLVAAVVGHLFQTGPMFTLQPLTPDFKRMNPVQTIRRVFSFRTVWEIGKVAMKLLLLAAVAAPLVWKASAIADSVAATSPARYGGLLGDFFVSTSVRTLIVLGVVAALDLLFARREFMKKMRMSRRELKDEIKHRDGDPAVKSKQKQQLRELLKKTRALSRVRDADVVLTNPTHVAVALRYRPGETLAPVVLAKGAGAIAGRIRLLAGRYDVPIVRSPVLARALYAECDIDGMVPPDCYLQLAPVYRSLWAVREGGAA